LLQCLHILFNLCWMHGFIPMAWKQADTYLIPKKASAAAAAAAAAAALDASSSIDDYRPISVTSSLARAYENVIYARLHPCVQPAIHPYQFGFAQDKSAYDALFVLTSD